ncbi:hypothetical protein AGMMS49957_14900 [Synergistales bacterium]|nr:hypothetical protein AGMMS49957_14900 [Synergistales bacterium]
MAKIGRNAALEFYGLSDVQNITLGVPHNVDAGFFRKSFQNGGDIWLCHVKSITEILPLKISGGVTPVCFYAKIDGEEVKF